MAEQQRHCRSRSLVSLGSHLPSRSSWQLFAQSHFLPCFLLLVTRATICEAATSACNNEDMYRNIAIICAVCAGVLFAIVGLLLFLMKRILDHQRVMRQISVARTTLRSLPGNSTNGGGGTRPTSGASAYSVPTTTMSLEDRPVARAGYAASQAGTAMSVTASLGRALSGFDQSVVQLSNVATNDDFTGRALPSSELKMQRAAARRATTRSRPDAVDALDVSRGGVAITRSSLASRNGEDLGLDNASEAGGGLGKRSGSQSDLDFGWPEVEDESDGPGMADFSGRQKKKTKRPSSGAAAIDDIADPMDIVAEGEGIKTSRPVSLKKKGKSDGSGRGAKRFGGGGASSDSLENVASDHGYQDFLPQPALTALPAADMDKGDDNFMFPSAAAAPDGFLPGSTMDAALDALDALDEAMADRPPSDAESSTEEI